jgi:Zn-dependent protease
MFISRLFENPMDASMYLLVIIFSICVHEYMHARAALWQGDSTAAEQGHLTLNPLKQMGIFSLIMLLIIGLAFGSVPVNPDRMKHKYSNAIVSFAGPFANLILFFIFGIFTALAMIKENQNALNMFAVGTQLNFVLFCFNVMPVPPLDGFGILSTFFPKLRNSSSEFINGATLFLFMILLFSFNVIFTVAAIVSNEFVIFSVKKLAPLLS